MKLLSAFIAWVLIMFIEVIWLMNDFSSGGGHTEIIYAVMIISLVVGATGLNLYSKNLSN